MIKIKSFAFNGFQVNTYVLHDETNECVIIDAACYGKYEMAELMDYMEQEHLKPVRLLNTHCHVDHIQGNYFIYMTYGIKPEIHEEGLSFLETAKEQAQLFGFQMGEVVKPEKFISDGEIIKFGNSEIEAIYTPGHAEGSLCFVSHKDEFVITGDVLFAGSIGRTDLPTGSYKQLMKSIREKLLPLGNNFTVYPGHGPKTSIEAEIASNPFLQ